MLHEWETFYVIVGSAAAALTGLQFVVIALGVQTRATRNSDSVKAFASPIVFHFSVVLLISALMEVPGHTAATLGISFGILGLAGVIYGIATAHRAKHQTGYEPVFEDWLWHVGAPIAAYLALLIAAFFGHMHPAGALYVVAMVALLLLFVGIHNAWDSAVYISAQGADGMNDRTPGV